MNRIWVLAALWGVLSSPRPVSASPPHCPPARGERLDLIPSGVTANGLEVVRDATAGRYVNDAGLDFDLELSTVVAEVTGSVPGCEQPSGLVQLEVIDPYSNERASVTMEVRP